jgi:membrane dipeptidase
MRFTTTLLLSFIGWVVLIGQGSVQDEKLRRLADKLAHRFIIADGHVDLPYRLKVQNFRLSKAFIGIPIETADGDFDYVRAKKGGLDAPFMSIYVPSSYQESGGAKILADSLIDMVRSIALAHPDKFAVAVSPKEVEKNFRKGIISLPLGMENGAPIEGDLKNVSYFYQRGIRYITLTHATDNFICDSSYDTTRTWKGLSPMGKEVVREMNRVGIMVDISHVSDSAFYQTLAITRVPVIASHSSMRRFTPGFERNMNDDMLQALATNGGVIMINFGSSFLDSKITDYENEMRAKLAERLEELQLNWRDEAAKPIIEIFQKEHPKLFADVELVADHIDHARRVAGIRYIGLGSDYDGVGDSLPTGLKDVSQYPNLIYALLKRGYTQKDIERICYKNLWRVWKATEKAAEKV